MPYTYVAMPFVSPILAAYYYEKRQATIPVMGSSIHCYNDTISCLPGVFQNVSG
ncbi:hypothetical protein CLV57_2482 [Mucilaginibacter auburnensis]|uniref:Uncharacterized protein n=1 Tax=Mucilaginibacter auburnensis TaxID=1457233 RepID=A0A2H9VLX8_9SPHI|nr:hypothetical protein CLV57_2482 [Mucilaginibacter auburnensis]